MLPNYKFDVDNGIWKSRNETEQQTRIWLGEIDYSQGFMGYKQIGIRQNLPFSKVAPEEINSYADYMALAHDHLLKTVSQYKTEYGKSLVD